MYKICTNPKCEKAGIEQPTVCFSRKSGKLKYLKGGKPAYQSHCKRCGVIAQNERIKKKRANAKIQMAKIKAKVQKESAIAKEERARKGITKRKTGIDPRYLVRGNITHSNRSCNITNSA